MGRSEKCLLRVFSATCCLRLSNMYLISRKGGEEMDRVDVVEVMIGGYLGTFCMLGCLGLWEVLFGLRMDDVGIIFGLFMGLSSALCGMGIGLYIAYALRRFV